MVQYNCFESKFGPMAIVWKDHKVLRIYLPDKNITTLKKQILNKYEGAIRGDFKSEFKKLQSKLLLHLSGKNPKYDFKILDFSGLSDFQAGVLKSLIKVPYGKVSTYRVISESLKPKQKSFRAVGTAIGKNPFPLMVPCHRIIKSDGKIGNFTCYYGVSLKKVLLDLERR